MRNSACRTVSVKKLVIKEKKPPKKLDFLGGF